MAKFPTHGVPIGGGNIATIYPWTSYRSRTKTGSSKDEYCAKNYKSSSSIRITPLKYPKGLGNSTQDLIKFSALEYKPAGTGLISLLELSPKDIKTVTEIKKVS